MIPSDYELTSHRLDFPGSTGWITESPVDPAFLHHGDNKFWKMMLLTLITNLIIKKLSDANEPAAAYEYSDT
jgi:hypothetical protein